MFITSNLTTSINISVITNFNITSKTNPNPIAGNLTMVSDYYITIIDYNFYFIIFRV